MMIWRELNELKALKFGIYICSFGKLEIKFSER